MPTASPIGLMIALLPTAAGAPPLPPHAPPPILPAALATQNAPAAPPPKLVHLPPVRAAGLLGTNATDSRGDTIGTIVNVLVDQHGVPIAAVIQFQGFLGLGNREIAVAWNALSFTPHAGGITVTETLDADKLKSLPQYVPDQPSVPVATRAPAAKPAP